MASGLSYKRATTTPVATKQLAATLAEHLRPDDVIVLIGDLGAGKTQFVQGIADGLGVKAQVTSPTFNIQIDYQGGRLPLHDTIESGGASFLEWGDKFVEALPYSYLEIEIRKDNDNPDGRVIYARAYGESARQLLFLWAKDSKSRLIKTSK